MPKVNIKENAENFLVEMAAPGMEKKDSKIELDGHTLTISSEKQNELNRQKVKLTTERNLITNHFTEHSICQKTLLMPIRSKQIMKMGF